MINEKDLKVKKEAIKKLVDAMKAMKLDKIKGYKAGEDDIPVLVAEAKNKDEKED